MSDHQFEKNVRKQLEELRFHPDASVWTAVEKRITDRKKKRRGIVWIPILFLLISGGIFLLDRGYRNNSSETTLSSKTSPVDERVPADDAAEVKLSPVTVPNTSADKRVVNDEMQPSASSVDNVTDSERRHTSLPRKKAILGSQPQLNTSATVTPTKKRADKANGGTETAKAMVLVPRETPQSNSKEEAVGNTSTSAQPVTVDESDLTRNKLRSLTPSTVFAQVIPSWNKGDGDTITSIATLISPTLQAISDSTISVVASLWNTSNMDSMKTLAAAAPVERRKSKVQWGISVEAGFSNVKEGGLFDVLDGTQKAMVQDVASNSFSSPLPANAVLPMPSDIRPGPALSAGLFIRKDVSKRIALSAGAGYSLLQTSIQVGQYSQSNMTVLNARGSMGVASVYRAGEQQEYNNQYHFLELPFEASFRLNKRKQYPIALKAGMTVARLIGSNALHFDGATRIYYQDNSLFNKTQVGISGGLSIGLLQRSAHPVAVGPFFHYRATSLMKYVLNGERHLLSYGLNVKVLLKK